MNVCIIYILHIDKTSEVISIKDYILITTLIKLFLEENRESMNCPYIVSS